VLTDVRALRAISDARCRALFDLVRRTGPATTDSLGGEEVVSDLQELEACGFVDRDDAGRWSTIAKGIYFEIPAEEGETQRAARELSAAMIAEYGTLPVTWAERDEPRLETAWARAAGLFNARVALTPDELEAIQAELERLLAPYTTRAEAPADAEQVRVLAFFLPESPRQT
jgi:enoyl-CoA hydratase/carnithine racemase